MSLYKKEISVILIIFVTALIFAGIGIILKNKTIKAYFDTPYSSSFSIFSYFRHFERPKYIVYGYLPYWELNQLKYFQLDRLTDVAYFGLNITSNGTFNKVTDDGLLEPGYDKWRNDESIQKLIETSKRFNVRVSLTVLSHDNDISDKFLSCRQCWKTFISSLEKELDYRGIKDVNLNFEYSGDVDERTTDEYTEFVDYVNKSLDEKYGDSFVTVATFADSFVKPRVTKPADLAKVSDLLFVMAYDFHRPDSDTAGPVAPLGGAGVLAEYDIETMLKDYLTNVPPNKFVMGVPYYGYNWVVTDNKAYAARIPGNDDIGYSQSQLYSDIMDTILEVKPKVLWDELGKSPYFTYVSSKTSSIRSVYFDNADSLKIKYEKIKDLHLAGVGIWALGYDGGYTDLWNLLKKEFVD